MESVTNSEICNEENSAIASALSNLSYNKYGELVYTQCNLSNRNLSDLYRIANYSFIQRLLLDDNHLTSLSYLENMPNLVYLSAARNRLTQTVFDEIAKGCAQTLEWLDISENVIDGFSGLSQLPYLVHVDLSSNKVRDVSSNDFKEMHVLRYIDLSNNQISSVAEDAFQSNASLKEVHCSHNEIHLLNFVSSLTSNIRLINVSANNITKVPECVNRLTKLMELDLSFNNIKHIDHLLPLTSLYSLRSLYIHSNPVCADVDASFRRLNFNASQKTLSGSRFDSAGEKIELTEESVLHEADEVVMSKVFGNNTTSNAAATVAATTTATAEELQNKRGNVRYRNSMKCPVNESFSNNKRSVNHMFAALSAAPVYGAVRRVLPHDDSTLALNKLNANSWENGEHKSKEQLTNEELHYEHRLQSGQETMSMTMMITWLIHHIPSLTEIDGCSITPQQRARAQRYRVTNSTSSKV